MTPTADVAPRHLTGEALVAFVHAGMDEARYRELADVLFGSRFQRDDLYAYRAPADKHYVPVRRQDDGTFRRSRVDDHGRLVWYGRPLPDTRGALYASFTDPDFGLVGSYPLVPHASDADVLRCCVTDLDEKERHADGVGGVALASLQAAYWKAGVPYHGYSVARSKGGKGYHVCTLHPAGTVAFAPLNLHRHLHRWAGLPAGTETYPRSPRASTRDPRVSTGSGQYALPGSLHHLRASGGSVLLDPRTLDPLPMREWADRERRQLRLGFPEVCEAADAWGVDLFDPRLGERDRPERPTFERCLRREANAVACTPERLRQFADYFGLDPGDVVASPHPSFSHHVRLGRCPREHHHSDAAPGNARLYLDEATGRLGWNCHHAHCSSVPWRTMRRELDPTNAFALGVRRRGPRVDPRTIDCPCSRCRPPDGPAPSPTPTEPPPLWARTPGSPGGAATTRPPKKGGSLWSRSRRAVRVAFRGVDEMRKRKGGAEAIGTARVRRMGGCRRAIGYDVCRCAGCGGAEGAVKGVRLWPCGSSYCTACGMRQAYLQRDHVLATWLREGHAVLEVTWEADGLDLDPVWTARGVQLDHVRPALNAAGVGYVEDGAAAWLRSPGALTVVCRREALGALRAARSELERTAPHLRVRAEAVGRGEVARRVHRHDVRYLEHVVEVMEAVEQDPTLLDRAACLDPDKRRVRRGSNQPARAAFPWLTLEQQRAAAAAKAKELNGGRPPGSCADCGGGCHHRLDVEVTGQLIAEFPPGTEPWRIRQAALSAGAELAAAEAAERPPP